MFLSRLFRWPKSDRQMLPIHQVSAPRVPPMHMPPAVTIRIVLVKHMPPPLVKDGTVRVVHPIGRSQEMITRAVRVLLHSRNGGPISCHCLFDCFGIGCFGRAILGFAPAR